MTFRAMKRAVFLILGIIAILNIIKKVKKHF